MHNTEEYIEEKLNEALSYVYKLIGKKELYTHEDALKLLNSFSYTEEIDLEDIPSFLPSARIAPRNLFEYTNGFISDYDNNKIYALNYGTGFIIVVISAQNGYITTYYGDTINDFTLRIYYCLEIMTKKIFN